MNTKLSCAIAAILSGTSIGATTAARAADAADTPANGSLEEVIVTAQRRSESMQKVPISMQAFTAQTLQQLNIATFDDYIKFLPNLSSANNGPGQNEVFMRGLSAGAQASQGSGSTGVYPNVAIYLDNQSGQLPNRNLDIYAIDLKRIEVLEGPQGTLFGSGAEAGAIRYITNEPKLGVTEGSVEATAGTTAHGDPNSKVTAIVNLPLGERFAVRAAGFYDRRGGYIDNVPATFTRKDSDVGIHYAQYATACDVGTPVAGACPGGSNPTAYGVPPGSPVLSNGAIAARAINPTTYSGIRAEALFRFNDDWDLLISEMYQKLETKGVFYQQPNASDGAALNPLEVTIFNNAYDHDQFNNLAWTLNGKFGDLKAVYTGGYLERRVEQVGDYTNYARGYYADYYQCFGPIASDTTLTPTCFSPSATWFSAERNEHMQHEFRLSTPDDWRVRAIGGVYVEDNKLFDRTDWRYKNVPSCSATLTTGCFADIGTFPNTSVENPGLQTPHSSFYQDTRRETKQTALFASMDIDLIPSTLTLTLGTRHFRFENSSAGSVLSSFYCFEGVPTAEGCHDTTGPWSYNLDQQNLRGSESGFKSRGNLTWHVTPNAMLYYTYSQGFRPGGFNQNGVHQYAYDRDGNLQFHPPKAYESDKLTNNEIGWKTEFLDHRLQWNGAVYRENWDNVQVAFFNPGLTGNIFFDTNGQNFVIKGIETSVVARVTDGLTVQGAASWNSSEQTNSPVLIVNVPASANYGKPLKEYCSQDANGKYTVCTDLKNPFGPQGSPSANAPPIQYSLRARYEWTLAGLHAFAQGSVAHTGHSYTQAGANPSIAQAGLTTSRLRFELPAYSTFDASIGVARDNWNALLYAENLGNSHASTFTSFDQFVIEETPLRPRVIGLTVGYKF